VAAVTATVRVRFGDGATEDRPTSSPVFLVNPRGCTPGDVFWSWGDVHNRSPGWRLPGGIVAASLRDLATQDPTSDIRLPAFAWRLTEEGGRWERAHVETFEERIVRLKLGQAEAIRAAVQEERDRAAAASLGGENAGLKAFSRLLAAAVEAEREACAALVDELTEEEFVRARADRREAVEWCATKIRERGKAGAA
jgi:hypothetical protein